jgi:hypothetical protein
MGEWIKIKDKLPIPDTLVLCVGAKGGYFIGTCRDYYLSKGEISKYMSVPNARQGRYATHWQTLPDPPEE